MSLSYLLGVDYPAVVRHIQTQSLGSSDIPLNQHTFEYFHEYLTDYSNNLLEENPGDTDEELTSILLDEFYAGYIEKVKITSKPGVVVHLDGEAFILPLIQIHVKLI